MHILLKDIIKEVEEKSPLKIQIYCDMDGVLVDMEKGFKEISGGLSPKEYETKNGKNSFWKVIAKKPTFWLDLEPIPDSKVLWSYIHNTFKNPQPVILSAGQGNNLKSQKTQWIRNHIDPSVQVIISTKGTEKPNYRINPQDENILHVLVDDTPANITAWQNSGKNCIAILHKDAASSIEQLKKVSTGTQQ